MKHEAPSIVKPSDAVKLGRLLVLVPVLVFLALAIVLGWGLTTASRDIPSNLIGRPVPEFNLPPIEPGKPALSRTDLIGEVSLVNVFASWCVACRIEHPLLMQLSKDRRVPIHGLNYKDQPTHAIAWLAELGDPYTRIGSDLNGRVAIDWGVYGVPETFVVSADGTIAYKHIGPVSEQALQETILPLIAKLRRQKGSTK